ncbi:hypothetical protein SASPL_149767 [Salvia splendens]|uniref:Uncharacterized protein n=1 Tax=Salvia splendens TaxID=180675 RepID=A0A8X8W504_SALSN|nr:uncharacterized protein LOC121781908 [Salvia splendens]KAG6388342.1 hypothetical protein SASPL_149767 [Salvia splendens]
MAISQTHFRSISLPSRLDHSKSLESECEKLKCGSGSSESLQSGLVALAQLYNSFEEFSQKSTRIDDRKSVEESLSRSVDLLDACGAIREVLQMMRENIRALQSAMRRKGTDSDSAQNDVAVYFSFRKRMQKTVAKTLKNLSKSEIVTGSKSKSNNHSVNADGEFGLVFKQLAGITSANLRSVLAFVSYAAERSLVSRLVAGKSSGAVSEIEDLDLGLRGRVRGEVAKKLQIVDEIVGELEGGFEGLFRQLIQTRVTLLNILTAQL